MQDNENIIEKIVSCPETLTDSDIALILADDQLREIYEAAVVMSEAMCDVPQYDTETSLRHMHGLMKRSKHGGYVNWLLSVSVRRAAAIMGICLTLTVLAAVAVVKYTTAGTSSDSPLITPAGEDHTPGVAIPVQTSEKLQYDDATLSDIIDDICNKYGCRAQYADGVDRQSRFHFTVPEGASLQDAVGILNAFDEVVIAVKDNTLIIESQLAN